MIRAHNFKKLKICTLKAVGATLLMSCILNSLGCYAGPEKDGLPTRTLLPPYQPFQGSSENPARLLGINHILVTDIKIPAAMVELQEKGSMFDNGIAQAIAPRLLMKVSYQDNADAHLKALLTNSKSAIGGNDWVEWSEVLAPNSKSELKRALQQRGIEGVLSFTLLNYVERQGSKLGSDRPAVVDFRVRLFGVSDGAVVWEGNYHFKDQSLADNLLNVKERLADPNNLGWKNADKMFETGVGLAMDDLSARREAQFTGSEKS